MGGEVQTATDHLSVSTEVQKECKHAKEQQKKQTKKTKTSQSQTIVN